jgi:pimeloyl-ACP methyl ester carboxylesterase
MTPNDATTITAEARAGQAALREPTRARYPDREGYAERNGRRLFYEVYGEGEPTVFLLPTWTIVHSRFWKAQVPYFARHFRVLTFDGLGNGRSDRPRDPRAYDYKEFAKDALAVMDETGTESALLFSKSRGAQWALELAANHAERVLGVAFIGGFLPLSMRSQLVWRPGRTMIDSWISQVLRRLSPIGRMHPDVVRADYRAFLEWFFREKCIPDPHSTRQVETGVEYGLDTDPETLVATLYGPVMLQPKPIRELCRRVRCPMLVINGDRDKVTPHADAKALARTTGAKLMTLKGSGHGPEIRKPVEVNLALREFVEGVGPPRELTGGVGPPDVRRADGHKRDPTVHRSDGRSRALFISSPIGLGHAQRDVAIARELRNLVPDLEVDWLAQHPVTRVLEGEGERIHPASEHLANESRHFESESAEHDLHCFQAWRRMDEILIANFMLFHDVVRDERYDLWIGDEAWELDYYLHENPGEKRAPYVWLTDFVGFLPMADGGEHERFLTADYNAQMVEHVEGLPEVRDRSVFVGNPDDIVDERLGPELPLIRDWTERHFDFAGYVTGFDPAQFADREALRAELGYGRDERVCVVTVGGSGVGGDLLRRVIAAFPEAKERVPELRMVVVAGPRIDPESLPAADGLDVRPYVHNLYRHLAACDLAVVQGGLTTAMELTASKRPFLYFPLKHHFEQQLHVHHRLQHYGAGRRMDFDESPPGAIAAAIADEIDREVAYRDVETKGAQRAAERIAELLR